MATLKYDAAAGRFGLAGPDQETKDRAKRDGWNWIVRSGTRVYVTDEAYAALPFADLADEAAARRLDPLLRDYRASFATRTSYGPPCPDGLEPLAFQPAGVEYCLSRQHALIGDEPGLGKTVEAILLANAAGAESVLCVVPGGVRYQWIRHIRRWSVIDHPLIYPIFKSADGVHPDANFVVVSYDLVRREPIFRALARRRWDLMILDEAHYLKTPEATRTRALFGGGDGMFAEEWLADRADRVLGLTGTPLPNRPREAYTLGRALCWEAWDFASYRAFTYRFNPSHRFGGERVGRLGEFRARLRCNFMVRRLYSQVMPDLPATQYEIVPLDAGSDARRVAAEERRVLGVKELRTLEPARLAKMLQAGDTAGQISTLRREMGEAMVPAVAKHVDGLLDGGVRKVVVFAHHRSVMDGLAEAWADHGVESVRGGITAQAKDQAIDRFISGRARVFLAQINVGGVGIDGLQHVAHHVVFAEASWVPGDNEQAVQRLKRIGQAEAVVAQFLVVEGSLSEYVLGRSIEKDITITEATDG